ncbi:MAG: ABC transporter ATP-binding protein [Spirochaetaceae bacterium]|jgi:lipoprotein-releasing system ATP-binding protein|nr:ABC transporter ATP-binding protein [Spirochaetaceae bacterium]
MSDSCILDVRGVEKSYVSVSETLTILKGLDLQVAEGRRVIIVGESGSGKSTLLNIIGGLDTVTAGTVRAGAPDTGEFQVTRLDEEGLTRYRSRFLGLIFQFHYLLKDFTALENVYLPAYMVGVSRKEARSRAEQLLSDVGLGKRLHHYPSQLSGGERQRTAVARALINDPRLILADEPTGNLDPGNASIIGELLFSVAERYRKTLLLVTHDRELSSRGDIRYHLEEGRLAAL